MIVNMCFLHVKLMYAWKFGVVMVSMFSYSLRFLRLFLEQCNNRCFDQNGTLYLATLTLYIKQLCSSTREF